MYSAPSIGYGYGGGFGYGFPSIFMPVSYGFGLGGLGAVFQLAFFAWVLFTLLRLFRK